jgi:ribonuclease BN (tRNA processing enzyme)
VTGGSTILLDCGPGTLPLLKERDALERLDAIFISHMARDHMTDLIPFTSIFAFGKPLQEREDRRKISLFVPREDGVETLEALSAVWDSDRNPTGGEGVGSEPIQPPPNRFARVFDVNEYSEDDEVEVGDLRITFRRTTHTDPCYAPRVSDGRATLVYSADAGYDSGLAAHAKGANLFLCEATFLNPDPFWTEEHGHMTGHDAGRLAEEAGVGRLVLTHLGPEDDENALNLGKARAAFGGTVDLARTGSVFYL